MNREIDYGHIISESVKLQTMFPSYELEALSIHFQDTAQKAQKEGDTSYATHLHERSVVLFVASRLHEPKNN